MLDSFAGTLRALRERNQLSLRGLAQRTFISFQYLSNIENGSRPATEEIAIKCDEALGSTPLLRTLLSIERGHPMLRRLLLGGTLGLASGALLSSADSTAALAAALNAAMRIQLDGKPDWDAIADDFARRYVLAPSPELGPELTAHITAAHDHAIDHNDADARRCTATLTLIYGLWIADQGKIPTAQALYATAIAVADSTTDLRLMALVRARAASRGPYEGWSVKRTSDTAHQALAMCPTGPAAVEAHSAIVHVAALTGRLEQGRAAVRAMYAAAGTEVDGPSPYLRAASFDNYLECRAGSPADADAAYGRTQKVLAGAPLWQYDAQIYYGRALVAAGDVTGGAQLALDAVRALPAGNRIVGLGVRDLLSAVPRGVPSEPVAALRGYASPGPAPWETLH